MELIVVQGSSERTVDVVQRDEQTFDLKIDGKRYRIDRSNLGGSTMSLIVDGSQFEVSVRRRGAGKYVVDSTFGTTNVEVLEPLQYAAKKASPRGNDQSSKIVTAYMPGRVIAILVQPGQKVEAGTSVVVLEAMKMENEIKVVHPGIVEELLVTVGDAVEGGDPLVSVV